MEYEKLVREEIYNLACKTGSKMINRMDKATLSNIISLFLGRDDAEVALRDLAMYIARQVGRKEIPKEIAQDLLSDLKIIRDSVGGDRAKLREAVAKYLVLLRFVFDSGVKNVGGFEDFMNRLVGGSRQS